VTFEMHDFLWAAQIGSCTIGITNQGLNDAAHVFLRSLASVSCLYFLTLTTPVTDMVWVLHKLRVPALLIELLTLIYRFILILLEVSRQIYLAQDLRAGYRNIQTGLASLGKLILSVFIKSYRQSLAMYDALVARCYTEKLPVLEERRQWSRRNILLIFLIDGALVLSALYAGGSV
ncbi:MAG: Cobalt ABC transporter, inner membrane subunit CbiQ, partial [Pelotomaculum thermopropionicum]